MPHHVRYLNLPLNRLRIAVTSYACCGGPMVQDGPGRWHCEECHACVDTGE